MTTSPGQYCTHFASSGDSSIASQVENTANSYRDPEIRWLATVVLTTLDPELGRIRLLQALDRPPEGFYDDMAGFPESLLQEVDETLLTHSDTEVREAALLRVMRRPDGGLSVLRSMVEDATTADVRRQAIATVVANGLPEDADIFRSLTEDSDRSIRMQGYTAMAELGDPGNEEYFRAYLDLPDPALRMLASYALLRMHFEE